MVGCIRDLSVEVHPPKKFSSILHPNFEMKINHFSSIFLLPFKRYHYIYIIFLVQFISWSSFYNLNLHLIQHFVFPIHYLISQKKLNFNSKIQ